MSVLLRRRHVWLVAAVAFSALAAVLRVRDANWVGDPLWGQETIGIAQVLVLPLVGALGAVEGWRDRNGILSLFPRGAGRARHVTMELLAVWLPITVAYGVANAVVVLCSARAELSIANASGWPVVTQLIAAGLSITAGYAIGYVFNSWSGAIVSAVLFAGWVVLDRMGTVTSGLAEYSSSGSMVGAVPDGTYFATRCAWMVAVIGAALLVLRPGPVPGRLALAATGTAVALVGGQLLFPVNNSYAFADQPRTRCAGNEVVVCGPADLADRIEEGARLTQRVATALRAAGVEPRGRYVMWTPQTDDQDWVMLVDPVMFRAPMREAEVVDGVVAPKSCPVWRSIEGPPQEFFTAAEVLKGYVLQQMRSGSTTVAYRRLTALHTGPQLQRLVQRAGLALQACQPQRVPDEVAGLERP